MVEKKKTSKRSQEQGAGKGAPRGLKKGEKQFVKEARLGVVADQLAAMRTRRQIIQVAEAKGWGVCHNTIDAYISEVRDRWRQENSLPDLNQKKDELIAALKQIYQRALARKSRTDLGIEYDNPDLWLMRQIAIDIAKIEGVLTPKEQSENNELDDIIAEITRERKSKNKKASD